MITLHQGDITKAKVDAIVNAANPIMLGGGGVDGAIHRAAGPDLLAACRQVKAVDGIRCPSGEARITSAGNLPARFVIHTVGPRYRVDPDPPGRLASAFRNALALAADNVCQSIAFPAISCGVYGYPAEEAAAIAIDACQDSTLDIHFYLFSRALLDAWQQALEAAE